MYPDWPETAADLVPLPLCDGPKLAPFDFHGPQQIDFLGYLGEGSHAHVLKVRIHGRDYALKLFRFAHDWDWYGTGYSEVNETREQMEILAPYSEPFYSECRAFGRLQESGHADLATTCHGYLLLDEAHERVMMDRFKLKFDGSMDYSGFADLRGRFPCQRTGKPPPIRGILKDLGKPGPIDNMPNLTVPQAKRMLRDTIKMHQLGIIYLDLRRDQRIDEKFCDFSVAITVPHFLTNPELNPQLSPYQKQRMLREMFMITINDYWNLELVLMEAMNEPRQTSKLYDKFAVFPGGVRYRHGDDPRHRLRSTAGKPDRVYTLVDPRQYA